MYNTECRRGSGVCGLLVPGLWVVMLTQQVRTVTWGNFWAISTKANMCLPCDLTIS